MGAPLPLVPADLAGKVEAGFPPTAECHVTGLLAPGRGDHGQDRLVMSPVEAWRGDDHGRPAPRDWAIREREGDDDVVRPVKGHATPRHPRAYSIRS